PSRLPCCTRVSRGPQPANKTAARHPIPRRGQREKRMEAGKPEDRRVASRGWGRRKFGARRRWGLATFGREASDGRAPLILAYAVVLGDRRRAPRAGFRT